MRFVGKTAVVTGAASGMGQAIVASLVAEGANVAGLDLVEADAPGGTGTFVGYVGSVADWGFASESIGDAYARFGRIDFLINAAGVLWFNRDRSVVDMDLDVWDEVLSINLKGCAHTIRSAVPLMKGSRESGDRGGAMVHFSTIQCLRGDTAPQDAYQASKAGVIALSKSVAVQFAADGIRSNTILPGPTRSPMQARWDEVPGQAEATAGAIPLGRVGTVEDMANACLFLLSDEAGFITGTELIVDGGLTALP